jgi:serine/threonine-protein kinase
VPEGLYCAACGRPLSSASQAPTRLDPLGATLSSAAAGHGRFFPGAVLAGRYRVVALLGRGGMGEVYRADDLKLGQPVALKFLPEGLERDEARLGRLMNEVRTARQVSHPNVCRVYDVGEADGRHFISMEYVDGEDLGSLLRRIGRLPGDKGAEIARQIAAGLAAAHEAGVLHRDLKPSNVMIDGRGRARLTDFGLASLAGEVRGEEARSGTPAYMAPEQLAGKEATARSDVYALGLVLYEMFTGRTPFRAATAAELRELQTGGSPASPAGVVEGLDPAVERVILRCLQPEPARRPSSALAVAAALPGGDPLAAALAAGETPSPDLVAAAGGEGAASPRAVLAAAGAVVAGLVLLVLLAGKTQLVRSTPMPKPPEVLAERAREIVAALGHREPPGDSLFAFDVDERRLKLPPGKHGKRDEAVSRSRPWPPLVRFRYRQSPRPLGRLHGGSIGDWFDDPPPTLPGMIEVTLDPEGRLIAFLAVPERRLPGGLGPEPDWSPLLSAAGLDAASLVPAEPASAPPVFADALVSWEGPRSGETEAPIRVEAAAVGGRPVAFRVVDASDLEAETAPPPAAIESGVLVRLVVFVVVVGSASYVALGNLRLGRGDRKGALRLAVYLGALRLLWLLGAHHVASGAELELLTGHVAWSMYRVGIVAVFYLALEPYARRLWPRMLISWTRLLHGGPRDPLVGRDVLAGCVLGVAIALVDALNTWLPGWLGLEPAPPAWSPWSLESLRGIRYAVCALVGVHVNSVTDLLFPVMVLVLLRVLLRRTWIALGVTSALGMVVEYRPSGDPILTLVIIALALALFWFALFRFGLLSAVVAFSVTGVLEEMPLSLDPASIHATPALLTFAVVLGLMLAAARASLAGRPLFRDAVLGAEAAG